MTSNASPVASNHEVGKKLHLTPDRLIEEQPYLSLQERRTLCKILPYPGESCSPPGALPWPR
ncbi:MAG: hypothetical protein KJ077_45475, partial [Anaerolineae bacterium]|nr:hypothetical protein [Anaerolineae bacterium]